jgi:hypothetical protein
MVWRIYHQEQGRWLANEWEAHRWAPYVEAARLALIEKAGKCLQAWRDTGFSAPEVASRVARLQQACFDLMLWDRQPAEAQTVATVGLLSDLCEATAPVRELVLTHAQATGSESPKLPSKAEERRLFAFSLLAKTTKLSKIAALAHVSRNTLRQDAQFMEALRRAKAINEKAGQAKGRVDWHGARGWKDKDGHVEAYQSNGR